MRYKVRLQHGTSTAFETVHAEDDDEAIRKAKARARRNGFFSLPMAYESVQIVDATEAKEER
jgi:hypothetical protein